MDTFQDMTPIHKKKTVGNDLYTTIDTQRIKTRLGDKNLMFETNPSMTSNPLNESEELLRYYTTEMQDIKNIFEGEQSSIEKQKTKVNQILKQLRALREKVPESHLPKSHDTIFGGYLMKWLDMLYPNGENNDYLNKNSTNTERATYVSMGIKRSIERCEKLKGQLFDSEEKSKMKTSIIQELSTNNSLLQSQLEMEKKNEERQNKIFQLEDQNLELRKNFNENYDRYEIMLSNSTKQRKKVRELKTKVKQLSEELEDSNRKFQEASTKIEESYDTNQSLREQLKKAKEKVMNLEESVEQTKNKVANAEQENFVIETKLQQLNTHFAEIIQVKDKTISDFENKETLLNNKHNLLKEKLNSVQLELQNEKQTTFELQRKLQSSLNNENESSNNHLKLQKRITMLESQLEKKEKMLENLQSSFDIEKKKNESFNENFRKKESTIRQLTEETVKLSERLLGRSREILDYSGDGSDLQKIPKKYQIEYDDEIIY